MDSLITGSPAEIRRDMSTLIEKDRRINPHRSQDLHNLRQSLCGDARPKIVDLLIEVSEADKLATSYVRTVKGVCHRR